MAVLQIGASLSAAPKDPDTRTRLTVECDARWGLKPDRRAGNSARVACRHKKEEKKKENKK
ncbi:MAG TPA: hypothetical protein VFY13_02825 [Luteolibacter sp.]|nr:hypothetical protein [Luteolibacter sp.]